MGKEPQVRILIPITQSRRNRPSAASSKQPKTISFIGYKSPSIYIDSRKRQNITKILRELIGIALILGYIAAFFVILALVGGD